MKYVLDELKRCSVLRVLEDWLSASQRGRTVFLQGGLPVAPKLARSIPMVRQVLATCPVSSAFMRTFDLR
jgi:hypothetical protein